MNNILTLTDWLRYMKDIRCEEYIVHMAKRYQPTEDYHHSYEVCCVDEAGDITWFNDWDEGQEDVIILGWCTVTDAYDAWLINED